jgi:hypothetical protein
MSPLSRSLPEEGLSPLAKKALHRLMDSLEQNTPYEGHEMLKTSYYRARSKSKRADSYDMCAYGALLHFTRGDYQCGMELGSMLLDSYAQDGVELTEESAARVVLVLEEHAKLEDADVARHKTGPSRVIEDNNDDDDDDAEEMSAKDTLVRGMQQLKHGAMVWLKGATGDGADVDSFKRRVYLLVGRYTYRITSWKGLGLSLPDLVRSRDEGEVWKAARASLDEIASSSAYYNDADLLVSRCMLLVMECISLEYMKEAFFMVKGIYERYLAVCADPMKEAATAQCVYLLVIGMVRRNEKLAKVALKALELSEGGVRDPGLLELCRGALMSKYVPSASRGGDLVSGLMSGLMKM